tara:strand:+ start:381 stop:641 length:261 start_codon:yes stop_codon:yes gene_type:complete
MKTICTECKGNGFVRLPYEQVKEEIWADCDTCNSQGEIDDRGPLDLTFQIEMLSKQKKILQDACRRAGKTIKSLENQLRTTIESTE